MAPFPTFGICRKRAVADHGHLRRRYTGGEYVANGPLAQLVERLFYMQDVVGSNPTGTTMSKRYSVRLAAFCKKSGGSKKDLGRFKIGGLVAELLEQDHAQPT